MSKSLALSSIAATLGSISSFTTSTPLKADRTSVPVMMAALYYNKANNTITVVCSDNRTRTCRLQRLPSIEAGRALWVQLKALKDESVVFTAAGGFSPDTWFYNVTKA